MVKNFLKVVVLYDYRLFHIKLQLSKNKNKQSEEKIIDLEKDPKTKEYKPKE